jgi:hypothetical protein
MSVVPGGRSLKLEKIEQQSNRKTLSNVQKFLFQEQKYFELSIIWSTLFSMYLEAW